MAELATEHANAHKLVDGASRVTPEMVAALEAHIDDLTSRFDQPTEFVVPGETELAARLDVARTVIRRAERRSMVVVADGSQVVPYLNRLSDLVWTLARWSEGTSVETRTV
jgi:cob(I)alamin adenosyltransferase